MRQRRHGIVNLLRGFWSVWSVVPVRKVSNHSVGVECL